MPKHPALPMPAAGAPPPDGGALARTFGLESDIGKMMLSIYGKPKAAPKVLGSRAHPPGDPAPGVYVFD